MKGADGRPLRGAAYFAAYRRATLDDKVEVTRNYGPGVPPDKLTCDRLMFRLKASGGRQPPDTAAAKQAPKNQGADAPRSPETSIERITASGTPAIIDAPPSWRHTVSAILRSWNASSAAR